MKKILFVLILVVFVSGCFSEVKDEIQDNGSDTLNISEENRTDFKDNREMDISSNVEELVSTCSSLCEVDKDAYCVEERTLIFEDNSNTIGSCRAFSKYNEAFTKCEGYCVEFGKGPKCNLESGTEDSDCDGE
jgi:hypothetical protein